MYRAILEAVRLHSPGMITRKVLKDLSINVSRQIHVLKDLSINVSRQIHVLKDLSINVSRQIHVLSSVE